MAEKNERASAGEAGAARRQVASTGWREEGTARLRVALDGAGRSVLAGLFQRAPLRILFPRPATDEPLSAVLLNTGGGIVGGDALAVGVRLEDGASAVVTSQAAEKAYRSAGADARADVHFELADGSWLEWLPQETILFDGARLRRTLRVDLAPRARLLAADMLVFGRRARGERYRQGVLHDRWTVRCGGRLVWADALRLAPEPAALLDAPFGFAGAGALATCIYVAPDAEERVGLARTLADGPDMRAGATCIGPVLVVRWLAEDPLPVRRAVQLFCARFRSAVAGLPERVPTIWRT